MALGKQLRKPKQAAQKNELYYATHYHLVPLYVLCGILLVAVLVMGCYLRYMWVTQQNMDFHRLGQLTANAVDGLYLPATVNPTDKKQYMYPASIRFSGTDPYMQLRYSYDPGSPNDKNGASLGITTTGLLRTMETQAGGVSADNLDLLGRLQQCSKLYVIRFEPGATQYGGFTPLTQVSLKDGRTAYIHKNTNCITDTNDGGTAVMSLETLLKTIESY